MANIDLRNGLFGACLSSDVKVLLWKFGEYHIFLNTYGFIFLYLFKHNLKKFLDDSKNNYRLFLKIIRGYFLKIIRGFF